jgi:hypothetical protein
VFNYICNEIKRSGNMAESFPQLLYGEWTSTKLKVRWNLWFNSNSKLVRSQKWNSRRLTPGQRLADCVDEWTLLSSLYILLVSATRIHLYSYASLLHKNKPKRTDVISQRVLFGIYWVEVKYLNSKCTTQECVFIRRVNSIKITLSPHKYSIL